MGEAKRKAEAMANGRGPHNCGSCMYFRRGNPGQPLGVCRARPPVPMMVGTAKNMAGQMVPLTDTFWPQVPDTEWCGSWSSRLELSAIDLTALQPEEMEGTA